MQIKRNIHRMVALVYIGLTTCGVAGDLQVGLFKSYGEQGMLTVLEKAGGMKVSFLNDLEADTLFRYDVIVLGSVKGLPQRSWGDDLQIYAQCGGGVLLCHDAVGYRGWDEPLFPQLFKGADQSREAAVRVTKTNHPVTKGLPARFEPMYVDHITLASAPKAQVLISNADKQPVMIAGEVNQGRVIGCGLLPGYAFIQGQNIERPPEGAECQLLIQAVRWLGEPRVTTLAPADLLKRRQKAEGAMALKRAAEVVAPTGALQGSGGDNTSWFDESRLNEQTFVHPPVALLPGRFFMFDDITMGIVCRESKGREYGEILLTLKELKWLGVTDIIAHSSGPLMPMMYLSDIPGLVIHDRAKSLGFDYLAVLAKACHEVGGLNVWSFWHSNTRDPKRVAPQYQDLLIRNLQGEIYGPYIDINNPKSRDLCKRIIDELAVKYNQYGNIKGILLDEFWHPFGVDYLERYVPEFVRYCKEHYAEEPPADVAAKFALGPKWHEPENVWWRRYLLWRNSQIVDFVRDIIKYANRKDLQILNQPLHTQSYGNGWFWGHGAMPELAQEGNLFGMYCSDVSGYLFDPYPRDRLVLGNHYVAGSGWQEVALTRGSYGFHFAVNALLMPIGMGVNPRLPDVLARQVRSNREWFGAEVLADIAVLTGGRSLDLQCLKPAAVFKAQDSAIRELLGERYNTSMLMTEDTRYYARYKMLVAPPYSLNGLSADQMKALQAYIEQGGCLVLLDGAITTSRPDFTQVQDRTADFTGLRREAGAGVTNNGALRWTETGSMLSFSNLVLSTWEEARKEDLKPVAVLAEGGRPVITERTLGKGKVLTVQFDVSSLLAAPQARDAVAALFKALVQRAVTPAIYAEGNLRVVSCLKKGNWVMLSLLGRAPVSGGREQYPARGRVYFDMKRLGIVADKDQYRVFSLARDREMMPQGKAWNLYGRNYWTANNLATNGVGIYIAPDELMDLALPTTNKDSYVVESIMPKWKQHKKARTYEHEIIAVAPAGESLSPGEIPSVDPAILIMAAPPAGLSGRSTRLLGNACVSQQSIHPRHEVAGVLTP